WTFSYIGFPVELNTVYFIGAHNIPNANMNEDGPSLAVNFTSPGSLWDPNITACKKNETMVEVNFTTSPPGNRYMALIQNTTVIGTYVLEKELTRTSVVVQGTGESEGAVVQDIFVYVLGCDLTLLDKEINILATSDSVFPYLCFIYEIKIRDQAGYTQKGNKINGRSVLGGWLPLLLSALLVATKDQEDFLLYYHTTAPPLRFLWFTHLKYVSITQSEVILEKWQKKKIAETGPVQWLTTQKKATDKVIFLLSNDNTMCDGTCGKRGGSPCENSQDLFPIAFNLFRSDLRSQTHLHKYVVVYFREDTKDNDTGLSVCPTYRLMKDATAFCTELLHAKQRVSTGRRPSHEAGDLKAFLLLQLQEESIRDDSEVYRTGYL
ncbi:hypothetical protein EI555_020111, partial [Monodon monoceros]